MRKRILVILFGLSLLFAAGSTAAASDPAPVTSEGIETAVTAGTAGTAEATPSAIARLGRFVGSSFAGAGAPFLWAILMVSAFATTVALEKLVFLYLKTSRGDKETFEHVARLLKDKRIEEARTVSERSNTPFGRIVHTIIGIRHGHRSNELQNLLDEAYLRETPVIQRRIPLLAVAANLATLLGLLGTIVGLIIAFDAVANVAAAQRTAALAAGISVAMATTGFGLIVAIPTLAAHGLLGSRADRVTEEIESRLAVLSNLIQDWNRSEQTDPYAETKTPVRAQQERLVDYVTSGEVK